MDAFVEVLARSGYSSASVEDVDRQAGASRSTFYEEFDDLDSCFFSLLEEIAGELWAELQDAVRAGEPHDAPRQLVTGMLQFATEQPARAQVLLCESLAGPAIALDLRDGLIERVAKLIEGRWRTAAPDTPAIDLPARALVGGIFRLLAFRLRRGLSGVQELPGGLRAWVDAYAIPRGPADWQSDQAIKRLGAPPSIDLPPAGPPPAVRLGSSGVTPADRARNQRERIIYATAQSCHEHGYSQVTVNDIVVRARLSRKVFYGHYRDKEHAAMETLEHSFETTMTAAARAFFAQQNWLDRLWAAGRALCEHHATHVALMHMAFVEPPAIGPAAVGLAGERLLAFTLLIEEGYHYRPEAEHLPRLTSEILASTIFEPIYHSIRSRKDPKHAYELLAPQYYFTLAPFTGPTKATQIVQEHMRTLAAPG